MRRPLHFDRAFSAVRYDGVMKELIHEFKYTGKEYLGSALGKYMLTFIKEYGIPVQYVDYIVPIPLYAARLREREFNQALVLGKAIAEEFHRPLAARLLTRTRPTRSQAELEAGARAVNVKDCFSVREPSQVQGKNILLVDDVLTTGATCSEAAYTLKKAGAQIVFALTLAN